MGENRVSKGRGSLRYESLNLGLNDVSRGPIDENLLSIIKGRIAKARVNRSGVVDLLLSWRSAKEVQ